MAAVLVPRYQKAEVVTHNLVRHQIAVVRTTPPPITIQPQLAMMGLVLIVLMVARTTPLVITMLLQLVMMNLVVA